MRHELHAIADPQHGHAEIENGSIRVGRGFRIHARGAAAEDDALRIERRDFLRRKIEADDLRIDLALADAPGDDLCVLGTEIEDDDSGRRLSRGISCRHWDYRESKCCYPD